MLRSPYSLFPLGTPYSQLPTAHSIYPTLHTPYSTIYASYRWDDFFELFLSGRVESGCFFAWHACWWAEAKLDPRRVLFVHYEDLVRDPFATVLAVARHCGLGLLPSGAVNLALIERVVRASSFSEMKAQHEAVAAPNHFRKGGSGGWVDYFTLAQEDALKAKHVAVLGGSGLCFDDGT